MSDQEYLDGEDLLERVFDDYDGKWPCVHGAPCGCWVQDEVQEVADAKVS